MIQVYCTRQGICATEVGLYRGCCSHAGLEILEENQLRRYELNILEKIKSSSSWVFPSKTDRHITLVTMVDTCTRQMMETCITSKVEKEHTIRPYLRSSIFPNVPPFINFLNSKQKYEKFVRLEIPWNLWTACHNPLLIRCMVRAGFKAKQVLCYKFDRTTLIFKTTIDIRVVLQKYDWSYMGCYR